MVDWERRAATPLLHGAVIAPGSWPTTKQTSCPPPPTNPSVCPPPWVSWIWFGWSGEEGITSWGESQARTLNCPSWTKFVKNGIPIRWQFSSTAGGGGGQTHLDQRYGLDLWTTATEIICSETMFQSNKNPPMQCQKAKRTGISPIDNKGGGLVPKKWMLKNIED